MKHVFTHVKTLMHASSENRENWFTIIAAATETEAVNFVGEAEMQSAGHPGCSGTVCSGASKIDRWAKTSTKNKRETKSELLKFKRLESHHLQQRLTKIIYQDLYRPMFFDEACCPLSHAVFFMKDIVYFATTFAVHTPVLQTILVYIVHLTNQCCFKKRRRKKPTSCNCESQICPWMCRQLRIAGGTDKVIW